MGFLGGPPQQDPRAAFLARPDALRTIPGQGIGTQPGPQTFPHPGQNFLQNLMMAIGEGTTFPLPDFGTPSKFWDPRIMGLLAAMTAVAEPGPGGEAKIARGADNVLPVIGLGKGKTVNLLSEVVEDADQIVDDIINGKLLPAVKSSDGVVFTRRTPAEHGDLIAMAENSGFEVVFKGSDSGGWITRDGRYVSYADLQKMIAPGETPLGK